ncbi:hypothetical protein V8D89_006638 [Ganoderma adspersum]
MWKIAPDNLNDVTLVESTTIEKDGETRELKPGTFVWVIPVHEDPEHTRKKKEECQRVDGDREDLSAQCTEAGSKVQQAGHFDCTRGNTNRLLESIGGSQEYVRTDIYAHVWETHVERTAEVARLNPRTADFPTLAPEQSFTRVDLEIGHEVVDKKYLRLQAISGPAAICKFTCAHKRIYAPHTHEVRWCTNCKQWFHVDCLKSVGKGRNFCGDDPSGNNSNIEQTSDSAWLWRYISMVRIARVPRTNEFYSRVLYSMETTIHTLWQDMARHNTSTGDLLPDFSRHLAQLVEHDARSQRHQLRMHKELMELLPETLEQEWYVCAGHECVEFI